MSDPSRTENKPSETEIRQISIATLAPMVMAALVVMAVVPVIVTGYIISTDTADRLLGERAELIVDGLENRIRSELNPAASQLNYAKQMFESGRVDPNDPKDMQTFVSGMLAGTPQVAGIALVGKDGAIQAWQRSTFANRIQPVENPSILKEALATARSNPAAHWSSPFVNPTLNDTIMNYRAPIEYDGAFIGILVAAVTGQALSKYVANVSQQSDATAFILLGRDRVIAAPEHLARIAGNGSTDLPLLTDVSDPVIADMWADQPLRTIRDLTRTMGHRATIDGTRYTYFYRELTGYSPEPLTIGVVVPSADTARDRWASTVAAGLGILLMFVAAGSAWYLGRRMARPAAEFNGALNAIARLDFNAVSLPMLQNSRVTEWRKMAQSLTNTAGALSAFQTYLPRSLVRRIFNNSRGIVRSRERTLTVMFADLEGFTAFSKGRDAADVAAHLNDLFGLIGPILENSGGVIDKYTGDGLLAFWGAPDPQPDHAARACRAAAEIAIAVSRRAENNGDGFPRLRLGLHSGPVVVGNIGFPGRIDYTLVGETVNAAERTEAALRGIEPDKAIVIAVTEAVLKAGGNADGVLNEGQTLDAAPLPTVLCSPTDER
ncbi:MAG: hypothetical protein NXI27_22280 [Alphaproteobacteria bacterium]|nr:hypothetical protein [Alphaproteobacteria bacterium]